MPNSRHSVLLVEDNPDDIQLAERALNRSNVDANLEIARSGQEALKRLSEWRPRAVFLDLNMPEVSGFEVLRRLRGEPATRSLPIVVLSTSKEPADVERCYDLGANSFVTKPLDFVEFSTVFAKMTEYWVKYNQCDTPGGHL